MAMYKDCKKQNTKKCAMRLSPGNSYIIGIDLTTTIPIDMLAQRGQRFLNLLRLHSLGGPIPACCLQSLAAPFRKQTRQRQLKLKVQISDEVAILFLGIHLGKLVINETGACPVWGLCLWLQPVISWIILE